MINIAPAILTTDHKVFTERMQSYLEVGFRTIDIDIQDTDFASDPTITVQKTLELLSGLDIPADLDLGFDLKVSNPMDQIPQIMTWAKKNSLKPRIVVYFQSLIDKEEILEMGEMTLVVGVLGSKKMPKERDLVDFDGVQLMTIDAEKQGGKLQSELLFRADKLWAAGYTGQIMIDGGVNLRSAELIRAYDNGEGIISQVSVGSYFQKAAKDELQLKMQKLQLALNI